MRLGPGMQRGLQVVVLSAVILVVAAIAGASPGGYFNPSPGEDSSLTTDSLSGAAVPEATPTPTPAPDTPLPSPEPSEADEVGGDKSERSGNHGKYVSQVAKCVPSGPGKGQAVSEMARTHENEAAKAAEICARYASPGPEVKEDAPESSEAGRAGKPSKPSPPAGKGNGTGKGNGKGASRGEGKR